VGVPLAAGSARIFESWNSADSAGNPATERTIENRTGIGNGCR
jgi:hypothetical protein